MPDGIPRPTAEAMGRVTSLSPPTPSDAQIGEWRTEADLGHHAYYERIVALCDALLGEREAHSATRGHYGELVASLRRMATFARQIGSPDMGDAFDALAGAHAPHVASKASKESNSE